MKHLDINSVPPRMHGIDTGDKHFGQILQFETAGYNMWMVGYSWLVSSQVVQNC